jgi:hypothetical protein
MTILNILNEIEALRKFVKDNYTNSSEVLKKGQGYVTSLRFYTFETKTPNILLNLLPAVCKEKTIYFHNLCLVLYLIHTFYDMVYGDEENSFRKKKNDLFKFDAYTEHYAELRNKSVLKNDVCLFLEANHEYLIKLVELSNYRPTLNDKVDTWFTINTNIPNNDECLIFNQNVKDYIAHETQKTKKEKVLKTLLKLKLNN